ncbi:unnamed protein product, partial [Ectocarpus sp. 8 AP-2014]
PPSSRAYALHELSDDVVGQPLDVPSLHRLLTPPLLRMKLPEWSGVHRDSALASRPATRYVRSKASLSQAIYLFPPLRLDLPASLASCTEVCIKPEGGSHA